MDGFQLLLVTRYLFCITIGLQCTLFCIAASVVTLPSFPVYFCSFTFSLVPDDLDLSSVPFGGGYSEPRGNSSQRESLPKVILDGLKRNMSRGNSRETLVQCLVIQELICIVPFGGGYSEPKGNSSQRESLPKVILDGLKRNMSRGNSLSNELDLRSVVGDTRAYLYSPVWGWLFRAER